MRLLLLGLVLAGTIAAAAAAGVDREAAASSVHCADWRHVPRDGFPTVSRNGRTIAWVRWTFGIPLGRVLVANPDGSAARAAPAPDGRARYRHPELSPDGKQVLYQTSSGTEPIRYFLADLGGRRVQELAAAEAQILRRDWRTPDWAPDGSLHATLRDSGLWIESVDGSVKREVISGRDGFAGEPAWSPDGSHLLFVYTPTDPATGYFLPAEIDVVEANGSNLRTLARAGDYTTAAWSPDATRIAFSDAGGREKPPPSTIFVINADGTERHAVTSPVNRYRPSSNNVTWLDDDTLVFTSLSQNENGQRVVSVNSIRTDGRDEQRLTYHCRVGTPAGETIYGSDLADVVHALGGNDTVDPGPGRDVVASGPGSDLIRAKDGTRDVINCGRDFDRVRIDRFDRVMNCEVVRRP
jgi:Tol biopolymer transport system component